MWSLLIYLLISAAATVRERLQRVELAPAGHRLAASTPAAYRASRYVQPGPAAPADWRPDRGELLACAVIATGLGACLVLLGVLARLT